MFKPRTAEDKLLLSTVRIETDRCTATGFFFGLHIGDNDVLITSRHAIQGSSSGSLRIHNEAWQQEQDDAPPTFDLEFQDFENLWIKHPDKSIDLVALPSKVIDDAAAKIGRSAHWMTIESCMVPKATRLKALTTIEDVFVVGYPKGPWDKCHNLPIHCQGTTATHPDIDFCGQPQLLVNMACLPGLSGSPVFVLNAKGYADENGNIHPGETRNILLGVVHAATTIGADGQIAARAASAPLGSGEESTVPLTYIVKSRELLGFADVIHKQQPAASVH
ncbi:MAG TPA: hypothetical protein VHD36_03890 [Pirellulales bacterium]|nr:hypothetical protein [Pirellulales bacterium]